MRDYSSQREEIETIKPRTITALLHLRYNKTLAKSNVINCTNHALNDTVIITVL